jgi:transposase
VLPSWIIDPLWDQFAALLPEHIDTHPLGCHRPRVPDRVVFDKLVQVSPVDRGKGVASATCPPGRCWPTAAWPARSPPAVGPSRSRWVAAGVIERSHAWLNTFGKLRWCTERRQACAAFYLTLACVVVIIRRLLRQAWTHYRWQTRPSRCR